MKKEKEQKEYFTQSILKTEEIKEKSTGKGTSIYSPVLFENFIQYQLSKSFFLLCISSKFYNAMWIEIYWYDFRNTSR